MKQLHEVQLHVLKKLLYAPSLSYTELKPTEDFPGNTFSFHLDTLKSTGHILKVESLYVLTDQGKEYANRIEDTHWKIAKPQKITAVLCCSRQWDNELEYLIYSRKKHPFYGKQWLFSGKIQYGEFVADWAKREMFEETNLTWEVKLIMVIHYLVHDINMNLLEDKFLHIFHCHEPQWELIWCNEGLYERVARSEIENYVTDPFWWDLSELQKIIYQAENFEWIQYLEESIVTDWF